MASEMPEHAVRTVTADVLGGGRTRCRGIGPIVVCDRVAHSSNIGQIIRLCCNVDARQLYLVQDPRRMFSMRKVVARAAQGRCFWDEGRAGFINEVALEAALPARRTVIGVETAEGARDLYAPGVELAPATPTHALVLVFGAESTGISAHLLGLCDFHVFVPCPGPMKSLNVSQCVAVVLCEWLRQSRYVRGEEGVETELATPPRGAAAAVAVAAGEEETKVGEGGPAAAPVAPAAAVTASPEPGRSRPQPGRPVR